MYSNSILSVFYICLFVAVGQCTFDDTEKIVASSAVWTSVAEYWDAALNADNNTALLTNSLNSLSQLLTNDVYWSTPYTTAPVSGRTNVVNNLRNVEAPKITQSSRVTGVPRVLSTTLLEVQLSFLVTHYQTLVADASNPLPRIFSQVERVTAKFRKPLLSNDYSISSLSIVVVQNEEDDLIQEIIALRQQNQQLAGQLNGYLAEEALSEQHRQTLQTVYQGVVYPNQLPIINQGILPHVFSDNVRGRIHPVGTFTDLEGTIEYFYGLTPTSGDQRIVKADLVHFTSKGNIAASEVIFYFQNPNNLTFLPNMTQKGFWRFDDEGLVVEFDLEILNLELRQNALGRFSTNPAYRTNLINTVCNTQAAVCTGNNTQFASVAACVSFMNSIDFGTTDRYWANSVQCRSLHLKLASLRPQYHCAHVGPTGGGKCIDIVYNSLYQPLFPTQPRLIGN